MKLLKQLLHSIIIIEHKIGTSCLTKEISCHIQYAYLDFTQNFPIGGNRFISTYTIIQDNPLNSWIHCSGKNTEHITHCGLVTPYGGRDLGKHWFRQWLVAWRHQVITWTNVDLSSLWSHDVILRAISLEISQPSVTKISFKNIFLRIYWNRSGANELINKQLAHVVISPWKLLPTEAHNMSPVKQIFVWMIYLLAIFFSKNRIMCFHLRRLVTK